jgi:hypothetical protein
MINMGLPASRYAIGTTYAGSYLGADGQMPASEYLGAYNDLLARNIKVRGAYVWDMTIEARNGYVFAATFGSALRT